MRSGRQLLASWHIFAIRYHDERNPRHVAPTCFEPSDLRFLDFVLAEIVAVIARNDDDGIFEHAFFV